jgi:uncharacterized membrane protein
MRFRHLDTPLHKTLAFGCVHVSVAVAVGWALTGSFVLAGLLALVEPALNTAAFHVFDRTWTRRAGAGPSLAKSSTFGVLHLLIAVGVGWALTGSLAVAGAMALVEPAANSVALYFFERWWTQRAAGPAPLSRAA